MLVIFWNRCVVAIPVLYLDRGTFQSYTAWTYVGLASLALLFCLWRFWRFTIHPYLHPEEPKQLPYLIPYIGHAISFFGSSHNLIERGLNYLGRTHEPFALQVGPETLYIITAPKDVAEVYKKANVLTWDGQLNQIFLNFGFDPQSLKLAWLKPVKGDSFYLENNPVNPRQLPLIQLIEHIYAKQLLPGLHADEMSQVFIHSLQSTFCPSQMGRFVLKADNDYKTVSLKMLCQHALLKAGIVSFFGRMVEQLDPGIIPKMLAFNENAWMLFYGLPSMFSKAVSSPKTALIETFVKFLSLSEDQRSDQSWSVQQILVAQEIIGIDPKSQACMLIMILWAANSNVNNTAFWLLTHILFDEQLRHAVKEEISRAWESGDLDIKFLLDHAPVLDSAFYECLRLKAGAMMGRKTATSVEIGGKILKPNASILIPSRQLHSNEKVWGADHRSFDVKRLMGNERLLRHSSYRPFGGGVSLCPGRKIAKEQVFAFVAILIYRYDIAINKEMQSVFPEMDTSTPALGVLSPAKAMDVLVDLTFVSKSVGGANSK